MDMNLVESVQKSPKKQIQDVNVVVEPTHLKKTCSSEIGSEN